MPASSPSAFNSHVHTTHPQPAEACGRAAHSERHEFREAQIVSKITFPVPRSSILHSPLLDPQSCILRSSTFHGRIYGLLLILLAAAKEAMFLISSSSSSSSTSSSMPSSSLPPPPPSRPPSPMCYPPRQKRHIEFLDWDNVPEWHKYDSRSSEEFEKISLDPYPSDDDVTSSVEQEEEDEDP